MQVLFYIFYILFVTVLLFTGQECAELRIPWENVQLEKQKSICEANFVWFFACYWNGVNSNDLGGFGRKISYKQLEYTTLIC